MADMGKIVLEEEVKEHPTKDRTNRFGIDQRLRKYGYKIYSRKKGKEAIWVKDNIYFTENEAVQRIQEAPIPKGKKS